MSNLRGKNKHLVHLFDILFLMLEFDLESDLSTKARPSSNEIENPGWLNLHGFVTLYLCNVDEPLVNFT